MKYYEFPSIPKNSDSQRRLEKKLKGVVQQLHPPSVVPHIGTVAILTAASPCTRASPRTKAPLLHETREQAKPRKGPIEPATKVSQELLRIIMTYYEFPRLDMKSYALLRLIKNYSEFLINDYL